MLLKKGVFLMRKFTLLALSFSLLTLTGCNFIIGDHDSPIEKNEIGFSLNDSNSHNYTEFSIFDEEHGLSVRALYDDYSSKNVDNYTYVVKNSKGEIVDTSLPFGKENVGSCEVTVTYKEYDPKTVDIEVQEIVNVTSVSFNDDNIEMYVNSKRVLGFSILPENAYNKNVTFYSADTTIVSVDKGGTLTGLKEGETDITIVTDDGEFTDTCHVTVVEGEITKTAMEVTYKDFYDNHYYNIDSAPTLTNPKLLIIPVWFTDSGNYINTTKKESVRQDIETVYLGTPEETGWHSVKSYYQEESQNKCIIDGKVTSWYECGYSSTSLYKEGTETIVEAATNNYFNTSGESRSDYDRDGDGYLDGIILIYAAPNYASLGNDNASNLWAYCFWLQGNPGSSSSKAVANTFFWASYDFMYGTNAYSRTGNSYGYGNTDHCTLDAHTYIHEMGHVFGLDDYYDYGENRYSPAAGFSMQDNNVGGHDPYSVMAFGWADPYIPTESITLTIGSFQKTRDLILLTPSFNSYNSPFDEYLLLELYTPTGLNKLDATYKYANIKGPSSVGIRLWHVDARLTYGLNYSGNFSTNLVHSPEQYHGYGLNHACSNTYQDEDYSSVLSGDFQEYSLLRLIRNSSYTPYHTTTMLSNSDLFGNGSSFTFSNYQSQFYNSGRLNNSKVLGWSFNVSINGTGHDATATVELIKL